MRHLSKLIVPILFVSLASCGGQSGTPATAATAAAIDSRYSPTWVLLTVDSARIGPKTATETWDPADTTPTIKDTAENLASLLSFATQEGGMVAQALASLIPEAQPSSDVTLPDPQVVITYNETVASRRVQSPRAIDTFQPTWGYAFFARIDNLRDRGLDLEVVDDDDSGRQERVALVNVARSLMQQVATSGVSQTLDLHDGVLEQLRVRVEPVALGVPAAVQHFALPLRQGLIPTHVVVPRGAVLTVRVAGSGKVGNGGFLGLGCPTDVTPAGIPGGACRDHNLSGMPELQSSAHGSAVALIGTAPDVHAVSLANGDSANPCVTFAAPAYGELVFAVNDRDSTDNEGEFSFDLEVAPPSEAPADVSESPTACR